MSIRDNTPFSTYLQYKRKAAAPWCGGLIGGMSAGKWVVVVGGIKAVFAYEILAYSADWFAQVDDERPATSALAQIYLPPTYMVYIHVLASLRKKNPY